MSATEHRPAELPAAANEREWLIPCTIMTVMLGAAAVLLMPAAGYTEVPPYFTRFLNWMVYTFLGATLLLTVQVVKMWWTGVESPIGHLIGRFRAAKASLLIAVAGVMLCGIDMLFFMWIKPEVTAIAPFRADELYAQVDHAIFGTDPWRLFQGIDLTFHAWAYSFFWAIAIMGTLVWLFAQPSSKERSTTLLSYFVLWSIFGPIGQMLGSAAGPIFYRRIGLGDRFLELENSIPEVTQRVSGYLWDMHTTGEAAVGAGISAMPSLHIATVVWIYLTYRGQRSRIAPFAAIFAFYIFALSVALGWHYAIDGIAGAVGAFASHWACRAWLRARSTKPPQEIGIAPAA